MTTVEERETIKIEKNGDGITWLFFNRPEKRNAMSPTLHREMVQALDELQFDDETGVLVLTGAGSAFCAGQDLQQFFRDLPPSKARERAQAHGAAHEWRFERLGTFPKATIAMVNGWCCGGALTQVYSCDFAIAAEEAHFCISEVNFGGLPGGMVSKILANSLSYRDALYYILTGDDFDGRRAAEIGFVNFATPLASLKEKTTELALKLLDKNPYAIRASKEAFRTVRFMSDTEARGYLEAKSAHLREVDPGGGRARGMSEFLDDKAYRPALGSYLNAKA